MAQENAKITLVPVESGLKAAEHKLTVIHFWATWCVPCVAELPAFDAFAKAHPNLGVMALSEDDSMAKVKDFFAKHNITAFNPALDTNMTLFRKFHVRGLPTTLFINDLGQVFARADGPLDWKSKEVVEFIESRLQ